jgi:mannose-1-phosphate guanylyltransferase
MRALLLAAGLGTRLRPLTDYLPKCLVPIHGRPLLDYWLELLVNNGFNEILVNTHYLAPLVVKYVLGSRWGQHVTIVYEDKLLGTAGTILANKSTFQGEPFLVAHADNLTIFDPLAFIRSHQARPDGCDISMMLFKTLDPKSCGIVDVDQYGIVKTFYEKALSPPGNLANAAVYILEPAVLDFIAKLDKIEVDLSTEVIPHFIGRISTYLNNSYHRDIGTIESWQEAQLDFKDRPVSAQSNQA